jgi:hypothetical protein
MTEHWEPRKDNLNPWTSRYSNPRIAGSGLVPVGITRGAPRFQLGSELRANLYDFAPTSAMLRLPEGPDHRERFTEAYRQRLDALGAERARELLVAMQDGDAGLVLLCYEDLTTGTVVSPEDFGQLAHGAAWPDRARARRPRSAGETEVRPGAALPVIMVGDRDGKARRGVVPT